MEPRQELHWKFQLMGAPTSESIYKYTAPSTPEASLRLHSYCGSPEMVQSRASFVEAVFRAEPEPGRVDSAGWRGILLLLYSLYQYD